MDIDSCGRVSECCCGFRGACCDAKDCCCITAETDLDIPHSNSTSGDPWWWTKKPCGIFLVWTEILIGMSVVIGCSCILVAPQYSIHAILVCWLVLFDAPPRLARLFGGERAQAATGEPWIFPFDTSLMAIAAFAFFKRRYDKLIEQVRQLGEKDKERYDREWGRILSTDQNKAALSSLAEMWTSVMDAAPKSEKRQPALRKGPVKFFRNVLVQDPSLSELFDIADVVNCELMRKGAEWAEQSRCALHAGHDHDKTQVFWNVPVKNPARALDKVYRSYNEDVGRLCDLCRISLVYEDFEEVERGLRCIHTDH